jgi:xanthosine utilization system XapX-like protein
VTIPLWVRATVLLLITFTAGVMVGVAYDRHLAPAHAPPADARQLVAHLERELKLDSAQRVAMAAILARHQGAVDSAWRTLQPHVGATLDSVHREMMAVLTPEQRARFVSLMMTMHGH